MTDFTWNEYKHLSAPFSNFPSQLGALLGGSDRNLKCVFTLYVRSLARICQLTTEAAFDRVHPSARRSLAGSTENIG